MFSQQIQKALMLSSLRKAKWFGNPGKDAYWGSNEDVFTERYTTKLISNIVGFDIIKENGHFSWSQTLKAGHVLSIIDENIKHLIKRANLGNDNKKAYLIAFDEKGFDAFDFSEDKVEIKHLNDFLSPDSLNLENMASIDIAHASDYVDEIVIHTPMIDVLTMLKVGHIHFSQVESKESDKPLICLAIRIK